MSLKINRERKQTCRKKKRGRRKTEKSKRTERE